MNMQLEDVFEWRTGPKSLPLALYLAKKCLDQGALDHARGFIAWAQERV